GGSESLGEPMVHRGEQVTGLTRPALSAPQAGEARGSSQLPGKSVLTSCRLERLPEAFHGVGDRPRCARSAAPKPSASSANRFVFRYSAPAGGPLSAEPRSREPAATARRRPVPSLLGFHPWTDSHRPPLSV